MTITGDLITEKFESIVRTKIKKPSSNNAISRIEPLPLNPPSWPPPLPLPTNKCTELTAWLTVPKFRHLERLTNKFKYVYTLLWLCLLREFSNDRSARFDSCLHRRHLRFVKFFLSGADDVVKYRKWKQVRVVRWDIGSACNGKAS